MMREPPVPNNSMMNETPGEVADWPALPRVSRRQDILRRLDKIAASAATPAQPPSSAEAGGEMISGVTQSASTEMRSRVSPACVSASARLAASLRRRWPGDMRRSRHQTMKNARHQHRGNRDHQQSMRLWQYR
jgi:hypothetical protein